MPRPDFSEDNKATNQRCPNGHTTQIHVTGQGYASAYCPTCHWNDSMATQTVGGSDDLAQISNPQARISQGVRVMSPNEDSDKGKTGVTRLTGKRSG
jgi:hypothetical protein